MNKSKYGVVNKKSIEYHMILQVIEDYWSREQNIPVPFHFKILYYINGCSYKECDRIIYSIFGDAKYLLVLFLDFNISNYIEHYDNFKLTNNKYMKEMIELTKNHENWENTFNIVLKHGSSTLFEYYVNVLIDNGFSAPDDIEYRFVYDNNITNRGKKLWILKKYNVNINIEFIQNELKMLKKNSCDKKYYQSCK